MTAAAFALPEADHLFAAGDRLAETWGGLEGQTAAVQLREVLRRPGDRLLYWHGGSGGLRFELTLERRLRRGGRPPFDCLDGGDGRDRFDLAAARERLQHFAAVPL